jgi:hypothetical protein
MSMPCLACLLGDIRGEKSNYDQELSLSTEFISNTDCCCATCEEKSKIEKSYRSAAKGRLAHLPTIEPQNIILPDDNIIRFDVVTSYNFSVVPPSIQDLQVALE